MRVLLAVYLKLHKHYPGILAPIITGFIVEATNSFNNAFYLATALIISGIFIVGLFSRPPEKVIGEVTKNVMPINIH